MDLIEEYARQFAWRSWPTLLGALPPLAGATVLDLGCGPGGLAAELAGRGARVLGVDGNAELVAAAQGRGIEGARFLNADLRELTREVDAPVDGIWCSFAAAYFVDLERVLAAWRELLVPGGWIALTEVDDMFAHEPVRARTAELFEAYVEDGLRAGRYDFRMGRKLADRARAAGFTIERELEVPDRELAFSGAAGEDVLAAWRQRFERMGLLARAFGDEYEAARDDFLAALASSEHVSRARVCFCLARR